MNISGLYFNPHIKTVALHKNTVTNNEIPIIRQFSGSQVNNSISFGMQLSLPQRQIIQNTLDRCVYSKKDLIFNPENAKNFEVFISKNYVNVTNFFTEDKGNKLSGVCHELAVKAGKIIEQQFGDKYKAFIIRANNFYKDIPHYYLGLTEKSRILPEFNEKEIIRNPDKIRKILDNSILIDPSYKIYEPGNLNNKFGKYPKSFIMDMSCIENGLHRDIFIIYTKDQRPTPLILGSLEDLAPEVTDNIQKNLMLFMQITPEERKVRYVAADVNKNGDMIDITNGLKLKLNTDHPLIKFINRTQNQISLSA